MAEIELEQRPQPVGAASERAVVGRELTKRYGEGATAVDALRGVDVDLAKGSFTAIMGPSGSGKSTLLHILAGPRAPTAGWVEIDGTRLDDLSDRELTLLRRERIGFVFQSYNLLPVLTAEENITLPVKIGGGDRRRGVAGDPDRVDRPRASAATTGPASSRAASSSGSRSPAP